MSLLPAWLCLGGGVGVVFLEREVGMGMGLSRFRLARFGSFHGDEFASYG